MEAPAHLLLIDADATKRDLLKAFLKRHGFLISAARDLDHARRLMEGLDFDLIVVDAGDEAEALMEGTRARVIWLVRAGENRPGETLAKPFDPPALVERINSVLDRHPPVEPPKPKRLTLGPLTYDIDRATLCEGETWVKLTATEVKLMARLATRPHAPITRAELADEVGADPASRAVDVQITRLRRKLEADPKNPRYLQTVRGTGYMLSPD